MPLNQAPIQQDINTGGRISTLWVKWFEAVRLNMYRAPSYTVATLPTGQAGDIAFISNESGGAVLAFNDGTNWRRCTDRAVVS
jgi:hypothetical protein